VTARSLPTLSLAATVLLCSLGGCTIRAVSVPHHADIQPLPPLREREFAPSFDCGEAASAVQDMVCGSKTLSALDTELAAAFRRQLRDADLIGRDQLLATQRHFLATRRGQCHIPPERRRDSRPDPALETCLARLYRERIAAVSGWSVARRAEAEAPIAAYVAITGAEYREAALCTPLGGVLEAAIQRAGTLDPAQIPEMTELAGTHGAAAASQPYPVAVASYQGGPDQGYQLRARSLKVGETALDQTAFIDWIKAQPNHGGRFSLVRSDAGDFAAIDVVRYDNRLLAIAVEPWGYYAPAAVGESSYAGVFEIAGPDRIEPRCLYKTYLRPPAHGAFESLPNFAALDAALEAVQGAPAEALDPNDRREAHLFDQELRWSLFNQPLIGTGDIRQGGWAGWLHHRHDATLDALFAWSERDLTSKILYRKLITLMRPAQDELVRAFEETDGLTPGEAAQAAELVLIERVEHGIGRYAGSAAIAAAAPGTLQSYRQRFATAPAPGDLEAGRPIRSLHSAVLNHLPEDALADYLKYEFMTPGHAHSTGAGGETSLMAAVEAPQTVSLLLKAGADPNESNAWAKTPLMAAAQADQPEAARLLLERGADPEAVTIPWNAVEGGVEMFAIHTGGRTALMYAAAHADPALISLLLDRGARPQDRDSSGRRACDYLADNPALTDTDRRAAGATLCR
jgi:uncharacterized protein YecT (DUF1311 family)